MSNIILSEGTPHPPGATVKEDGVNFSIFSQDAEEVELLIFNSCEDKEPVEVISLDPVKNRTFHFWHVHVSGISDSMCYAYRLGGPFDVENGHRFNKNKVIVDPYAKGLVYKFWDRGKACGMDDNLDASMRAVTIDTNNYDWEDDKKPKVPMEDLVIYEMHVGGFTRSNTSNVEHPGTFKGVIEKIPYLKSLNINAVELLPVFDYDATEVFREFEGQKLKNYWGYSTVGFFAPHSNYCTNPTLGEHIKEFRDMVKALHKEGIEVILDVVFNHTSEGNQDGPVMHFKGMDNLMYYFLSEENKNYYMNYSGCGNTVSCNTPITEKFIIDCLKFWTKEMHVDGFRFDEGSILSRGEDGGPVKHPPILWELELSETFADTKLITEAWDADGLYQIGSFPGYRWGEWNGRFRDDVRKFVKGTPGAIGDLASRISGSADIYQHERHLPINSINFVACHDGFTMMDLVSYNEKHNEANGEDNKDGINDNISWNCGAEGATDNEDINNLRKRQIKNFISILMLSKGIPMLLSGDEVGRTQGGNNNAYCQDNDISWFDWSLEEKNSDLKEHVRRMIELRKSSKTITNKEFYSGRVNERGLKDIEWHGCKLYSPGWEDPESKVLSFTIGGFEENESDIHVILNADYKELEFEIPNLEGRSWYRYSDSYEDIEEDKKEVLIENNYIAHPYSSIILISK